MGEGKRKREIRQSGFQKFPARDGPARRAEKAQFPHACEASSHFWSVTKARDFLLRSILSQMHLRNTTRKPALAGSKSERGREETPCDLSVLVRQELPEGRNPQGNEWAVVGSGGPASRSWGPPDSEEETNAGVAWGDACQPRGRSRAVCPSPKPPGDFLPQKRQTGAVARKPGRRAGSRRRHLAPLLPDQDAP